MGLPSSQLSTTTAPPPSAGRKRRLGDVRASTATPSKRPKVAFDPEVEVRVTEGWDTKNMEEIQGEVRLALKSHLAGDDRGLEQVKAYFRPNTTAASPPSFFSITASARERPPKAVLRKYILALENMVGMLGKSCSDLVQTLLEYDYLHVDDPFADAYIRFLGSVVSAQGTYTLPTLKMLVAKFVDIRSPLSRKSDVQSVEAGKSSLRLHQSIRYILKLAPAASGALATLLSTMFPFVMDTARAHVNYVQNMLTLTEYAPELKGEVLSVIVERLVKIDVQIQVDMEELGDEAEDELIQNIQDSDAYAKELDFNDQDSDTGSVSSDEDEDAEATRMRELKASVIKMDLIMDILFDFFSAMFGDKSMDSSQEEAFQYLLCHFSSTIIPSFRSRHVQFLLFHFAQKSPAPTQNFVGACIQIAFDRTRSAPVQQAAAAYLASFIARGAHVPSSMVRDVFELLDDQLEILRTTYEQTTRGPDLRRYGNYYSIVQAILYILCFRWRDLLIRSDDDEDSIEDEVLYSGRDLRWALNIKETVRRNVYSKLNPLKVCAPVIVAQFARIAHRLRLIYVYPLLEKNKRVRLAHVFGAQAGYKPASALPTLTGPTNLMAVASQDSAYQLDAYFPFDPYHLPKSKRWLEGDYLDWSAIQLDKDTDYDEQMSRDPHAESVESDDETGEEDEQDEESDASVMSKGESESP